MASGSSVLDPYELEIKQLIEDYGCTLRDVGVFLGEKYGLQRGCSERNLQVFCSLRDIHRFDYGRISRSGIDTIARGIVQEVGPSYGRRMFTGLLRSRGFRIGERVARGALARVAPVYQAQRRNGTERLRNPLPYFAEYAGHKLHMDQNEKLVAFGVTHVLASDGYSGKIVGACSMPIKNNTTIYDNVYRSACLQYGLWDQVRVDCGREFYLVLYQQDKLSSLRTNTTRQPFVQTQSKQNHIAERLWVEINHRSTYPIKRVLVAMKNRDMIDMEDQQLKYCVSEFLLATCRISVQNAIDAWNLRTIPGKGVPESRFRDNFRCRSLLPSQVPPAAEVVEEYRQGGGQINEESLFGIDPLHRDDNAKYNRDQQFFSRYTSFETVAHAIANHQEDFFEESLLHFIDVTLNAT